MIFILCLLIATAFSFDFEVTDNSVFIHIEDKSCSMPIETFHKGYSIYVVKRDDGKPLYNVDMKTPERYFGAFVQLKEEPTEALRQVFLAVEAKLASRVPRISYEEKLDIIANKLERIAAAFESMAQHEGSN